MMKKFFVLLLFASAAFALHLTHNSKELDYQQSRLLQNFRFVTARRKISFYGKFWRWSET